MKITSIDNKSNTNFNGKFLYTPALRRVLQQSEMNSITRFEEIVQKSESINDKLIFKLDFKSKLKMVSDNIVTTKKYILSILDEKTNKEDSFIITDSCDAYSTKEQKEKNDKKALGLITDFIEQNYYSEEKINSSNKAYEGILKEIKEK